MDSWQTDQRHYASTPCSYTKRTLSEAEWLHNIHGDLIVPWKDWRYLENEHAALIYIAKNTTIPVPKVRDYSVHDGIYSLTTERINGIPLDMIDNESKRQNALQKAITTIEMSVLPQLRGLRSGTLGGLTGHILTSERIRVHGKSCHWPSKSSPMDSYVFCHGDLAQHNILINPETLEIAAIIDWENSGFFPPDFEDQLWEQSALERAQTPKTEDHQVDRFISFLRDPEWRDWEFPRNTRTERTENRSNGAINGSNLKAADIALGDTGTECESGQGNGAAHRSVQLCF